jgi:hypothetical protein
MLVLVLHDNKWRRGRRRLLQPVPVSVHEAPVVWHVWRAWYTWYTARHGSVPGVVYQVYQCPCLIATKTPTPPGLSLHCPALISLRAPPSCRPRPSATPMMQQSCHPTIPPCHAMIQPMMLRLTPPLPLDAGALPPRTRNAPLPSRLPAPSGPLCFWLRPRLYHAQRSHTLPLRFRCASPIDPLSQTPTVPAPCPVLLTSHSPACRSIHANANANAYAYAYAYAHAHANCSPPLADRPSSPGQVACTALHGGHAI